MAAIPSGKQKKQHFQCDGLMRSSPFPHCSRTQSSRPSKIIITQQRKIYSQSSTTLTSTNQNKMQNINTTSREWLKTFHLCNIVLEHNPLNNKKNIFITQQRKQNFNRSKQIAKHKHHFQNKSFKLLTFATLFLNTCVAISSPPAV